MKNLFVVFSMFISSFVFGQSNTMVYRNYYCNNFPKFPSDTSTKIFNGIFNTSKLYIAQALIPKGNRNGFFVTCSDSFTNEIKYDFIVDNPTNPTELFILQSKIKFKLYPTPKFEKRVFGLGSGYSDSIKIFTTDSDFMITFFYHGNVIESVTIGLLRITENTYNFVESWYKNSNKNKKINRDEILVMFINEIFIKDLSKFLPNKNYAEELVNYGTFEFCFSSDISHHDLKFDRWFGSVYDAIKKYGTFNFGYSDEPEIEFSGED